MIKHEVEIFDLVKTQTVYAESGGRYYYMEGGRHRYLRQGRVALMFQRGYLTLDDPLHGQVVKPTSWGQVVRDAI